MKVIIAGSRSIVSFGPVAAAVEASSFKISEVVSGHANGVDKSGEVWAQLHNVKCVTLPANWRDFGSRAGIMRNHEMAEYADALVAVWDGESRGTAHMIETMRKMGKPVFLHVLKDGVIATAKPEYWGSRP